MPINYDNAKIYCIRNKKDNDKIVYIGSTVRPISERMADHRKSIKLHPDRKLFALMSTVGVENFHAELVCNFPCTNREELLAEEGRHIRLNGCIGEGGGNTVIAGRTTKMYYAENAPDVLERVKLYYEANKERINERQKAFRDLEENKAKKSEYNKKYNAENGVEQAEKRKEYFEALHATEAYKEGRKEYYKKYTEANRAKIAAKNKAYYERKKVEAAAAKMESLVVA